MKKRFAALLLSLLLLALLTPGAEAAEQTLINKSYLLPENFIPADLTPLRDYMNASDDALLNAEAAAALVRMAADLELTGNGRIQAVSGYRSYALQNTLYRNKTNYYRNLGYDAAKAQELAARVVAPPGASEHQSGYAVDVDTLVSPTALTEKFADRPEGKWLTEHCWEYGFILRYPKDKTEITGYIYEPWHFRYVGRPHARYIMENNLCLEEYINLLAAEGGIYIRDPEKDYLVYLCQNTEAAGSLPWRHKQYSALAVGGEAIVVTAVPNLEDLADFLVQEDVGFVKKLAFRSIQFRRTEPWSAVPLTSEEGALQLAKNCLEEYGWEGVLAMTLK